MVPSAEGTIVEVLERFNTVLVGRVVQSYGVTIVAAEDKRIHQDIIIPYGKDMDAVPGDIVEVEITTQPAGWVVISTSTISPGTASMSLP